ncbi:MAG: mammalian cell entry protein, partial [Mycobacterium sp.]|nr:mammalian cell entry protein [Mycobacterium sp.]
KFYLAHKAELRTAITNARNAIGDLKDQLGPALNNLKGLKQRLEAWLGPQGVKAIGGGTLMASDICFPSPGRTC